LNRKQAFIVSGFVVALMITTTAIAAGNIVPTVSSQTPRTTSVDIEALNVAREIGAFLSVRPGNFTTAFSFAPLGSVTHINRVLLSLVWNQNSLGHIGDQLSIEINANSPTLFTMNQFASAVIGLNNNDIHVGANSINIGIIPIDPFATQFTTQYQLYEVRVTVEYTFVGIA